MRITRRYHPLLEAPKVGSAAGALSGSTTWLWSASLSLPGDISGTSAWTWTLTGILGSPGDLAGSISWVWTLNGTGALIAAATGSTSWTWTLTLTNTAFGHSNWHWSTTARMHGCRSYIGCRPSDYTYSLTTA